MSERTLMAVHAHPDDESSSTGGVLAAYGDSGVRTVVVTCTNGEMGDGPGHAKPGEPGHDPDAVARTRLAELDEACRVLGVTHSERLGYRDSGMAEWTFKNDPRAFCNVPLDEGAQRLLELFDTYEPDVVVTYSDNAGYNHPDHLHAHRITAAAVARSEVPAKLYLIARRRRDWQAMRERLEALGVELPPLPQPSPERLEQMARLEGLITTTVDVRSVIERKRAALAAHASQLDESWGASNPPTK
jgi:LmbE family N-acetylglucosaminyl deacetylase